MIRFDQVLVVDGSRVVRDLLARLMRRHSNATHATDDCEKARGIIEENRALTLVIADLDAAGGGGLRLLEFIAGLESPRPAVLLIGRHFGEAEQTQAELLGAIGCIPKPITFQAIVRAARASESRRFTGVAPRLYAQTPAQAHLLDPDGGESQMVWGLHDLSVTGALIDTRGVIPVGTRLSLALALGPHRIPVEAEVVRVQEPAWETLPGVGVRFVEIDEPDRERIAQHLRTSGARGR